MIHSFSSFLKIHYRLAISIVLIAAIIYVSLQQSYLLFHTIVELMSIVVAFTVFIITWNARKILANQYLFFVGIAYFFIAGLDLLHTLTFPGMNILPGRVFYANQFWVATRFMEAMTFVLGFYFVNSRRKVHADALLISYLIASTIIILSILEWHIFPVCFIEGEGQTDFKIYAEYVIIAILFLSAFMLYRRRKYFEKSVFYLLAASIAFTILSEFCFTLYDYNQSILNAAGHLFKVIGFYLIYKANVETGFTKPTAHLFKEVNDSELRYRTLANNLPVIIYRFNKSFTRTYSNASSTAELPPEQSQQLEEQVKNALKEMGNAKKSTNLVFQLAGESKLTYAVDIILENQFSKAIDQTYLVLCQDISKLKSAEERLTELNETKDKFFSIIAHDLKNPFTTILASSEFISKSVHSMSQDTVQQLAIRTHESAKNAYLLLENLLNWSRVQTGVLKPQPEKATVGPLMETVLKSVKNIALAKNIRLNDDTDHSLVCYADMNMVETILRNLIVNAIKFSYPDSEINLYTKKTNGFIEFFVADKGIGMSAENMKNLFGLNTVYIRTGTAKEKGTGLGLQLCKDFTQLNGGTCEVESVLGEGSTFSFSLPEFRPAT